VPELKNLENQYYETLREIKNLKLFRRNNANKKKKRYLVKASLRKEKKLRKILRKIIKDLVANGFLVDLTTLSVLPLSLKKSRFLRNEKGYYQKSLLIAKKDKLMFAYLTNNSQIVKADIQIFKTLIERQLKEKIIFLTDNRHKVSITVSKSVTMEIERIFSQIKKPIYCEIKKYQKFNNGKIYTDLEYDTVFNLYCERLKRLNIHPLNF